VSSAGADGTDTSVHTALRAQCLPRLLKDVLVDLGVVGVLLQNLVADVDRLDVLLGLQQEKQVTHTTHDKHQATQTQTNTHTHTRTQTNTHTHTHTHTDTHKHRTTNGDGATTAY